MDERPDDPARDPGADLPGRLPSVEPVPGTDAPGTGPPAASPWAEPPVGPPRAIPTSADAVPPPPPEAFSPPPPARRSRRGPVIAIVAVAVLVLGGVAAAAISMLSGSSEHLLGIVPADTDVFATAYLDPSAGQKVNLVRIAGQFPDLGQGGDLTNRIDDGLDQVLNGSGLTHADIEPWLGSQIGMAVDIGDDGSPHVAALVVTTDEEASKAALTKMREHQGGTWHDTDYDGVTISWSDAKPAYAIVDGVVVLGSDSTSVKRVIDAAHGTTPALDTSQTYLDTTSALPEGKLGLAFVNVEGLVNQFGSSAALSAAGGAGGLGDLDSVKALAVSVSAEPNGLALDMTTSRDPAKLTDAQRQQFAEPGHENTALAFVPSDAFAVVAQEHMDTALRSLLDTLRQNAPDVAKAADDAGITDAIDALNGDVAVEARPGTDGPVAGALVLGTDDEKTMQGLLDSLGQIFAEEEAKQEAIAALYSRAFNDGATPADLQKTLATLTKQAKQIQLQGVPITGLTTEQYQGVTITSYTNDSLASAGFTPAYAVVDGAAVVATSPGEIHALIDTKASGDDVRSATVYTQAAASVPSTQGFVFFDVQAIAAAVRENLPPDVQASYDRDVAPNLEPVGALAIGADSTAERTTLRMFLLIRQKE